MTVYDITLSWYLQIPSQFHYQTKAQIASATGSDKPQTSGLCPNNQCLKTKGPPCFLIKSNFITSLFDGTTAAFCITFSKIQKLTAERHTGTQQRVHIDS